MAPSTDVPSFWPSTVASARMPMGAIASIQRTTTSIVSAIPRKNASCAVRGPSLTLPSAKA